MICIQIFASHAIGGLVGNILTGIFAQASVAGFDGKTTIPGGWLDHHWPQVGFQLANSVAGMSYSFVVSVSDLFNTCLPATDSHYQTLILWVMHFIPPLRLRCNGDTEIVGVDDAEMGEFAYDYVGIDLELAPPQIYGDNGSTIGGRGGRGGSIRQRYGTHSDAEAPSSRNHAPMQEK